MYFHINKFTKTQIRWTFYDWANSVFALVITSTIFPLYFTHATGGPNASITIAGITTNNASLFSYILAIGYSIVAFVSPILSSYADAKRNHIAMLTIFAISGGISTAGLCCFTSQTVHLGCVLFLVSVISYGIGVVFNNAFLSAIANGDEQKLSGFGFAMGYVGSLILQIIVFIIYFGHSFLKLNENTSLRIGFFITGIWWLGFGMYSALGLRDVNFTYKNPTNQYSLLNAFKVLIDTLLLLKNFKHCFWYLLSTAIFTCGLQSVMFLASLFGQHELKMNDTELILTIFIIQFLGIGGAIVVSNKTKQWGSLIVLKILLLIWIAALCLTYFFVYTSWQFMLLASVVGFVMGGTQSLTRAYFAQIQPKNIAPASYFSLYDFSEKIATVIGLLSFGAIVQLSGNLRSAILVVIAYFIIALCLFIFNKSLNTTKPNHLYS